MIVPDKVYRREHHHQHPETHDHLQQSQNIKFADFFPVPPLVVARSGGIRVGGARTTATPGMDVSFVGSRLLF